MSVQVLVQPIWNKRPVQGIVLTTTLTSAAACLLSSISSCTAADVNWKNAPQSFSNGKTVMKKSPSSLMKPQSVREIPISAHAIRGIRAYMEDEHIISSNGKTVGVFDGHGGSDVARYLKRNFLAEYNARLSTTAPDSTNGNGGSIILSDSTIGDALDWALRKIDRDVLRIRHWRYMGSTAAVVSINHHESPDTATTADKDDHSSPFPSQPPRGTIVAANVGDSRAVLSRGGKSVELTKDHKPDLPEEKARIESFGGYVRFHGYFDRSGAPVEGTGVYRVNGNLALARAIGDGDSRPFISGECDLTYTTIQPNDEFIVVASDGLWDVMSSDDVVRFVHAKLEPVMTELGNVPHLPPSPSSAPPPTRGRGTDPPEKEAGYGNGKGKDTAEKEAKRVGTLKDIFTAPTPSSQEKDIGAAGAGAGVGSGSGYFGLLRLRGRRYEREAEEEVKAEAEAASMDGEGQSKVSAYGSSHHRLEQIISTSPAKGTRHHHHHHQSHPRHHKSAAPHLLRGAAITATPASNSASASAPILQRLDVNVNNNNGNNSNSNSNSNNSNSNDSSSSSTSSNGGDSGDFFQDMDHASMREVFRRERGLIQSMITSTKRSMAESLTREALRRGSTDNITAVVVWLK